MGRVVNILTAAITTVVLLLAVVGLDTVIGWVITHYTRWRRARTPVDPNIAESLHWSTTAYLNNLNRRDPR